MGEFMVTKKTAAKTAPVRRTRALPREGTSSVAMKIPPALKQEQTRSELATAAVVGVGALILEAELLPGILLGVAAMMIPKIFPGVSDVARPIIKSAIGMGYKVAAKTQQLIAEATDHAQDMMAEIKAERDRSHKSKSTSGAE